MSKTRFDRSPKERVFDRLFCKSHLVKLPAFVFVFFSVGDDGFLSDVVAKTSRLSGPT